MQSGQLIRPAPDDDLGVWISAFLDDCRLANLSPKTLRFYETNLGRFRWWCEATGAPLRPEALTPATIRQFLRYVQEAEGRWGKPDHPMARKATKDSTQHAYFRCLRRWFNRLVEQEVIARSPMEKLCAPRVRQEQPDPFSQDELERLATALRGLAMGCWPIATGQSWRCYSTWGCVLPSSPRSRCRTSRSLPATSMSTPARATSRGACASAPGRGARCGATGSVTGRRSARRAPSSLPMTTSR